LWDVDIISPNESESRLLLSSGRTRPGVLSSPEKIGRELMRRGSRCAVLKLGAKGSMIIESDGPARAVAGFKVKVVDTTAAGDSFTAGLAVALSEGRDMEYALRFANAAGALCCTAFGAQPALPGRKAVEKLAGRCSQSVG
jgi:ribokinase